MSIPGARGSGTENYTCPGRSRDWPVREEGLPSSVILAHRPLNNYDVLTFESAGFVVRTSTMWRLRIGTNGITPVAGLLRHEPNVPLFRQCAGRGNVLITTFPLKQFWLFIFPNGRGQAGLLDGDPEKRHTFYGV
jgi:hypothetical protein